MRTKKLLKTEKWHQMSSIEFFIKSQVLCQHLVIPTFNRFQNQFPNIKVGVWMKNYEMINGEAFEVVSCSPRCNQCLFKQKVVVTEFKRVSLSCRHPKGPGNPVHCIYFKHVWSMICNCFYRVDSKLQHHSFFTSDSFQFSNVFSNVFIEK